MFNVESRITATTHRVMHLRQATFRDVPALERMIEHSLRTLSRGYYTAEQIESAVKYIIEVDPQLIEDGTFFLVEHGTNIIACGGWSLHSPSYHSHDGSRVLLDPAKDPTTARMFYVHPDWTRRGIASWLMEESLLAAQAAGFRQMELIATKMGEPLYRRFGFRVVEPVEFTTPDGMVLEATQMIKDLS